MTKSYEGQDVISLYVESLPGQNITDKEIDNCVRYNTRMTHAQLAHGGGIQFRFETNVYGKLPVCQYAIVRDGKMIFRDDAQWFVPGDVLFNTFSEAVTFSKSIQPVAA